jgi:hypothetical protein
VAVADLRPGRRNPGGPLRPARPHPRQLRRRTVPAVLRRGCIRRGPDSADRRWRDADQPAPLRLEPGPGEGRQRHGAVRHRPRDPADPRTAERRRQPDRVRPHREPRQRGPTAGGRRRPGSGRDRPVRPRRHDQLRRQGAAREHLPERRGEQPGSPRRRASSCTR